MASVNKVILVGNLGADPEIRRTQDGRPIANLRLATCRVPKVSRFADGPAQLKSQSRTPSGDATSSLSAVVSYSAPEDAWSGPSDSRSPGELATQSDAVTQPRHSIRGNRTSETIRMLTLSARNDVQYHSF
jgi:hypothetical protein